MTKEETLLIPRYMVENYPNSPLGEGVYSISEISFAIGNLNPKDYPKIFKEIFWWEFREESEMPEYVLDKTAIPNVIYRVKEWNIKDGEISWTNEKWRVFTQIWYGMFPASISEYDQYIKDNQK